MSGPFDRKFTPEQCDAAAETYLRDGNAKDIARRAAAGELRYRGEPVPAFEIKPSTIASYGRKLRLRQQGKAAPEIARLPARDAIENLRIRFITVAHEELAHEERKKPGTRDLERIRQAERCALEAARLPGPTEARAASSGTRDENGTQASRTVGGMGGALLKDHRQGGPAQEPTPHTTDSGDNGAAQHDASRLNGSTDDGPGALPSEREHRAEALPVVV